MNKSMHLRLIGIGLALALPAAGVGQAAEPVEPDTSRWKCKQCLSYDGWVGSVEFGVIGVSESSDDFGRYNGLGDNGAHLLLNADAAYYAESGQVWLLRAWDYGVEQGRLRLDGGTQGSYRFRLDYDKGVILGLDGASTPYSGVGSDDLGLPAGWVRGATTGGMTSLNNALQPLRLRQERDALAVGVDMVASDDVEYGIDFRREYRDGVKAFAGGFLFNAVQFAAPVDSVTDTLEARLSVLGNGWSAYLTYLGSFYSNDADSVRWDNPYASGLGADEGRSALAPDNSFHQLSVAADYRLSDRSNLYGSLALGQGSQDQGFLPYTTNTTLGASALPRSSLNGRVDTVNANLRYSLRVSDPWRLTAQFRASDRYNKTAQASYDYIVTDALAAIQARTNLPYGLKERDLGVAAEYRVRPGTRLAIGLDRESEERTFQAVDETDESRLWAKGTYRLGSSADLSLKVERSERDATANAAPPTISLNENPLLTKYNTADRSREAARLHASYRPLDSMIVDFSLGHSSDDYDQTELGLTEARTNDGGVNLSYAMNTSWLFHGGYSIQRIDSILRGDEGGGGTGWRVDEEDLVETITFGMSYTPPRSRARFGLDLAHSVSHGRIDLTSSGIPSRLPLLTNSFEQARAYGVYELTQQLDLTAALAYELGNADDWALDGVEEDTIDNVLAFGADSIDYRIWTLYVGLRYRLDVPEE